MNRELLQKVGGGANPLITGDVAKRFDKKIRKYQGGFTLAEVLVTLGIIGVVSAMTIPTLMQNHQRKVYVTQLHKVYNEFQQAATAQITEGNAINLMEAGVRSDAAMKTFLQNQFKVVKDCTGDPSDCFADSYRNMNGGAVTSYSDTTAPCFVLASGAAICAKYQNSINGMVPVYSAKPGYSTPGKDIMQNNYIEGLIGFLILDTNGQTGPNIVGRDLFVAGIYSDGTISSALPGKYTVLQGGHLTQASTSATEMANSLNSGTNIEKCSRATNIRGQSDASYCFDVILNNNWEMEY